MIPQRNPRSPRILSVRSLVPADLETLRQPTAKVRIQRIRERHHKVARLLASGLTHTQIAQACHYTPTRVGTLASDPSVKELVATYRAKLTEQWIEAEDQINERIFQNTVMALDQIGDQLEDAEASGTPLPLNRLLATAADGLDRIGYQKRSTQVNINVDFAKNLEAAIARSRKALEPAE